jgi:luciferase family oxidoreductase group 1
MALPLSILDQSPILEGTTPADAVRATIALARRADALGYERYWLAEHHAMRGLADAAPEILLARIGAETTRIRIGSGGILLPHYSALKVAEQFRMLETLTPGRIDLGIGRAPGGTPRISHALGTRDVERFPEQVRDVIDYLNGTIPSDHPYVSLPAMPAGDTAPTVWILGSSEYGASLAAAFGIPFVFAHFISGDAERITRGYRRAFRPSIHTPEPRVMLAISALVDETQEAAEANAAVIDLWRLGIRRGTNAPIPSLATANAYPYSLGDRAEIAQNRGRLILGTPASVRARIEEIADAHEADEAMVLTIAPTYDGRLRSYELLAAERRAPVAA